MKKFKTPKPTAKSDGFTLIELTIFVALIAIAFGVITGRTQFPTKESCLNSGGKWSEGIEYGNIIQLCTYN